MMQKSNVERDVPLLCDIFEVFYTCFNSLCPGFLFSLVHFVIRMRINMAPSCQG